MKKFAKIILLFIFSLSFVTVANFNFSKQATKTANAITSTVTYTNYLSTFNLESTLFYALLALENAVNAENDTGFSSSFFTSGFSSSSPSSEDGVAIKNDLSSNKLNLTLGENSPYECLRNFEDKITNVRGLNNLDLSGIQTLILDDNSILAINSSDLSSLTNINILSVCKNSLSSFSINPAISGEITQLYLRDNSLTQVDLSGVALNATIDLAGNLFENFSDITFGGTLIKLDLSFNNITQEPNIPIGLGCTPIFFMQGLNKENFFAGDTIAVVNDGVFVQNLIIHVKYFAGDGEVSASEYYMDSSDILSSAGTIGFNQIKLPAGKIEISFSYVGNLNFPENNEKYFENMFIASKLPAPSVIAMSNGNVITTFAQTSPMNFSFSLNLYSNVANSDLILSDAVIYSGVSGQEQANLSTYNITTISSNTFSSYFVFDGITGGITTISASYQATSNTALGISLIILIFVVTSCVIYVIRWIRNGSPIAPLTDSEMFREKRRREKRQGRTDFPYFDDKLANGDEDMVDLSSQNVSQDENSSVQLLNEDKNPSDNYEKGRYKK
ncbi:MAG: hypothetical protein EOM55_03800 [Clostridia bacterium]|nr:hypothetical protein [Clostridia bacterium]